MAEHNVPVTDADVVATIRETREQAIRLQQRLRGVAAFIGREGRAHVATTPSKARSTIAGTGAVGAKSAG